MKLTNFADSIKITQDNYIAVTLNPNVRIDTHQFSAVNSSGEYLVNCTRDRYEQNCLLFYVENLVPLNKFINENSFDFDSLKEFILQIINTLIKAADKKLAMSNILLNMEYIFVDPYTKNIKIIYIPIEAESNPIEAEVSFQALLKDMVNSDQIKRVNEFSGFLMSKANSKDFHIKKFQEELAVLKKSSHNYLITDEKSKPLFTCIVTILLLSVFCLVIPICGNLLKLSLITKYISFTAIFALVILFGIGTAFSIVVCLLVSSNHHSNKRNSTTLKKIETNNIISKNNNNTDTGELNITNLADELPSKAVVTFEDKEYKAVSFSFSPKSNETNKTAVIGNYNNKTNNNNQTQVLFGGTDKHSFFIIKDGNTSVVDRIYIDKEHFVIGRNKSTSNFVVNEPSISSIHATIKIIYNEYFIIDNNSGNGTYLNGVKLKPLIECKLNIGDTIIFANQAYKFLDK